jgi:hypothetical protein
MLATMLNKSHNTIDAPKTEEIPSTTIALSKPAGPLGVILPPAPDEVDVGAPLVPVPPEPVNANPTAAGFCLNTV